MSNRTVGWLARRIGMTFALLYAINFVALIAAIITLVIVEGEDAVTPEWFNVWAVSTFLGPAGLAFLGFIFYAVVRLVAYWGTDE